MSSRKAIVDALIEEFKKIDGNAPYTTNLFNNVVGKQKFWDECTDFPTVCIVAGTETREYLPGSFQWGHLGISLKLYVKAEEPADLLENLINDIQVVINNNSRLQFGSGKETADIRILSIVTDEGLLVPYGIGEVNISIQYQVL
jgi:hypothetical protein